MSDRRAAIIRLLETRDDNLPLPSARPVGVSGFIHEARPRQCPDCLANDGRWRFDCETCGGAGVVDGRRFERISAADELPDDGDRRDPYSVNEKPRAYGLDGARHDATHARDRQIEMLGRQTRPALSEAELLDEANREPYAWETARARMFRLYDYRALNAALAWLRDRLPDVPALSNLTLGYLDVVLPDPLRAPGSEPDVRVRGPLRPEAGAAAKELRDRKMREAAAAGATVQELCDRFGVSKSTVYAVVNGRAAA